MGFCLTWEHFIYYQKEEEKKVTRDGCVKWSNTQASLDIQNFIMQNLVAMSNQKFIHNIQEQFLDGNPSCTYFIFLIDQFHFQKTHPHHSWHLHNPAISSICCLQFLLSYIRTNILIPFTIIWTTIDPHHLFLYGKNSFRFRESHMLLSLYIRQIWRSQSVHGMHVTLKLDLYYVCHRDLHQRISKILGMHPAPYLTK